MYVEEYDLKKSGHHAVIFYKVSQIISCDFRLFEMKGILCTHCLFIMKENGVDFIPEKYIVDHWRKNIKIPEVCCSSTTKKNKENPCDRFQNIAR